MGDPLTQLDPRLQAVANIVRPEFAVPTIIQTLEPRPGPTRMREAESLGAVPTYAGKFLPQIHADMPVPSVAGLAKSAAFASAVWYDEPIYASQANPPAAENPFRSTRKEIDDRVAQRVNKAVPPPKPNPHYRSYLGAQGPIMVPMETGQFTLQDMRVFTRSKELYDQGFTGRGAKVAVLDTGMDPGHAMLEGRITKALSFVPEPAGMDGQGHGTWCGSCIAGNEMEYQGKIKELQGKTLQGMSEADLVDIRVLTSEGSGATSGIVQGLEAAIEENVHAISMSLGSLFDGGGLTPDAQAVDEATRRGIPCVVAVGNQFSYAAVGSPASSRSAIAVGACAMQRPGAGVVASFSSKGPTRTGSVRPTICAPGGQMGRGIDETILGATSGVIAAESGEPYGLLRGSSMATPCVAGIVAQMGPGMFPRDRGRMEEVLAMGTRAGSTRPLGGSAGAWKDNRLGWGVIDAVRLQEALGRSAPLGVKAAAQIHGARQRPFLSALSQAMTGLRFQRGQRMDELRLTLL